MHTAAVDPADGFCHERRVEPVLERDSLGRELEGDDPVCRGEGIGVLEVDLMLACGDFVVGRLDLEAHVFSARTISRRTSSAASFGARSK